MSQLMSSFLRPGCRWLRGLSLLYQCLCICLCICVCVPHILCGCSDKVSPLCVIPGDITKESSLYSRPTELPPVLNKDIETCRCYNNTHTHTKGMIHIWLTAAAVNLYISAWSGCFIFIVEVIKSERRL